MGYEPLTPPDKQEALNKIEDKEGKTPFFMTAMPTGDGEFLLKFENKMNISVTKEQIIEMINQLSLGLML